MLISVGGGSPIDSAKAVAFHIHKQKGTWVPSIAIPTTLSVAETTQGAGFTNREGLKVAVAHPEMAPKGKKFRNETLRPPLVANLGELISQLSYTTVTSRSTHLNVYGSAPR